MRYLVLSDIHSNLEALTSVMADARRQGYDQIVSLGDIVGYGASPNEVTDLIRELAPAGMVRGNHDKAAAGITEAETFNDIARLAAMWTRAKLTPENMEFLRALPQGPFDVGGFLLSHGSPLDEEEYILCELDAAHAFEGGDFDVAFFGHTHFACSFVWSRHRAKLSLNSSDIETLELESGTRYLINPGSIGQPRDHEPKAAYAIFDTQERRVQTRRVAYDVRAAQERIEAAGLPTVLSHRLALGV